MKEKRRHWDIENEIARVLRKTKQEKIRYRDGWRNKTRCWDSERVGGIKQVSWDKMRGMEE